MKRVLDVFQVGRLENGKLVPLLLELEETHQLHSVKRIQEEGLLAGHFNQQRSGVPSLEEDVLNLAERDFPNLSHCFLVEEEEVVSSHNQKTLHSLDEILEVVNEG